MFEDERFTTPMMKQYETIKKQYHDCLLFYRMGDFYELFLEDAYIGSRVLGLTLTSRSKGKDGRIPMAGVPYHAVDTYLSKLVKAGYKVAICEQLTEPDKKGLIERDVVRIVTPGTILDENALDQKEHNYIVSLALEVDILGLAYADVSTGQFFTLQLPYTSLSQVLQNELTLINPSECILSPQEYESADLLKVLHEHSSINIFPFTQWDEYTTHAAQTIKKHFGISTLASFGIDQQPLATQASAALLGYLKQMQKHALHHIRSIRTVDAHEYVGLDRSTIVN
ncbi:DNA mismatch repair protein MutS, partial [Candidatus Cerribacteria bacterium 'Amazon FNV 2010 28 9']